MLRGTSTRAVLACARPVAIGVCVPIVQSQCVDQTKLWSRNPASAAHVVKKVSFQSSVLLKLFILTQENTLGAGSCTVFGDPHYKTFDGKFFSFKGSCKYQLVSDCVNHTFSIRVTNDGRSTKYSAWTKTVTLKMGNLRVNLGQKMRVKVNGTRVQPPYRLNGSYLDIRQTADGVTVRTDLGIYLLWDGNNFLQVQAAASFKNRLCGLCGNFNGISRDDLLSRHGVSYAEDETWRFANSWKVGGPKSCARKNENLAKHPECRHKRGQQSCRTLQESDLFAACSNQLNSLHYVDACRQDMCECPSGKCYCDSLAAYAWECARLGVQIKDWKRQTQCDITAIEAATIASTNRQFVQNQRPKVVSQDRRRKGGKKTSKSRPDFFSKHIPETFLIRQHNSGQTPPPID